MSLNHYVNSKLKEHRTKARISTILTYPPLEKVLIITVDGRTLTGTLISCDQVTNLVLADTIERIIREQGDDEPSTEQPHGLYLVRGDNVVVCGLVDEELDASIDWSKVRGDLIGSTKHV
jgi:U6 snRNA-associated Sm-like protein LSm8